MMVLAVLAAMAVVFFIIARVVTSGDDGEQTTARMEEKVRENIKPVGEVNVGSAPVQTAAAPAAARTGDQVYNAACAACHAAGVAGAPKVGDSAAWQPRAAKGIDGLVSSATNGLNAMPPMGSCADCSPDELKGAIEYMLQQSGL
jgi:cytochrome c5